MRSVTQRLAAAGTTPWVPLDDQQVPFQVSLFVSPSAVAVLTGKVQLSGDDPVSNISDVTISRTTVVATATKVAHGLSIGDSVIIIGAGAPLDGIFDITTVPSVDTFTYAVVNSGAAASAVGARLSFLRVFDHPTLAVVNTRSSGNLVTPVSACRFVASVLTGGTVDFQILQGMAR